MPRKKPQLSRHNPQKTAAKVHRTGVISSENA